MATGAGLTSALKAQLTWPIDSLTSRSRKIIKDELSRARPQLSPPHLYPGSRSRKEKI